MAEKYLFRLDDEVRFMRETGEVGTGYVCRVSETSKRMGGGRSISINIKNACAVLPDIKLDENTGRYYEVGGAQIFILPNDVVELKKGTIDLFNKAAYDFKMRKRQQTRMYRILKFIHDHPEGLRYGAIQKFIYEDIYKGRTYDPKRNRGVYGSNLSYDILPTYCVKGARGLWVMTVKGWEKVKDVSQPLYRKHYS